MEKELEFVWCRDQRCEIPLRLQRGMSANKDTRPWSEVDCEISHIDLREEWVRARMLSSESGWIVRLHNRWRGKRNIFYKGVETSPNRHILKTLKIISTSSGLWQLQNKSNQTKPCHCNTPKRKKAKSAFVLAASVWWLIDTVKPVRGAIKEESKTA